MRPMRSVIGKFKNLLDNLLAVLFVAAIVGIVLIITKHR